MQRKVLVLGHDSQLVPERRSALSAGPASRCTSPGTSRIASRTVALYRLRSRHSFLPAGGRPLEDAHDRSGDAREIRSRHSLP